MRVTAVFEPAQEGGYTCFVEEVPAAISQGETLEEAKANLLDALKLVLECQRELAEKNLAPGAVRETIELVGAFPNRAGPQAEPACALGASVPFSGTMAIGSKGRGYL
ncbi:MAG TPA: type II toxin-antitoxin system HicB family antitoxin [Terriglobia bacterium]|nr:type II toxin-antitoxin system HicB family antitoxin [Terriglobia bacterium]